MFRESKHIVNEPKKRTGLVGHWIIPNLSPFGATISNALFVSAVLAWPNRLLDRYQLALRSGSFESESALGLQEIQTQVASLFQRRQTRGFIVNEMLKGASVVAYRGANHVLEGIPDVVVPANELSLATSAMEKV